LTATTSGNLSTLFDVGGIVGGIVAGLATDITKKPASVCAIMLILAVPSVSFFYYFISSQ
jgi:OPA family glycerol-3-phosphate transporter-like MFS transporter 1/2